MNPLDLLTDESKRKFQEIVIESMKGEKTFFSADYEIRKKNGQSFWGLFHAKVNCKDGKPDTVQVFVQDITERKKIEEKLRISEERFSKAFKESPVAIAISRLTDGLFTDVNGAYLQIFGFDHDEIIGKTSAQLDIFVHPNQRKEIICQLREKGEIHNQEIRFKTKSGKIITTISSLDIINIANEDYVISTILDISERNRAEEELHSILENIDRGFMSVNRNWIIVYVNARAADNIGRKSDELIGKNLWIEFPQFEGTNIAKLYRKAMVERVAVEIEEYGVITGRWNQEKAYPTANGIAIAWADITERKKTEERLKENQERLETAQRVALVGSWDYFIKTDEAVWSKELYNIFGIISTAKAPNMQEYRKLIDPDYLNALDLRMQKFFAEGKLGDIISFDYCITRPNGSIRYLHTERMIREVDENGKPKQIMGIEQDITKRKKTEEALSNAQVILKRQLDEIKFYYDVAPVGLSVFDTNLHFVKVNKRQAEINGIPPEDHVGKSIAEVVPSVAEPLEKLLKQIISSGNSLQNLEITGEATNMPGVKRTLLESFMPMKDSKGLVIGVNVVAQEITEQKIMQAKLQEYSKNLEQLVEQRTKQLQDKERLAAIGATAGMVGHDIRNPLQAMVSDVYLLKDCLKSMPEMPMKQEVAENLDGLENNIAYINKIVADLQDYARPLNPEYSFVDLSEVMQNVINTAGVPPEIKISFSCNTFEKIKTEPTFIRRALTNLVNNAIQAMPNGGHLEVTCYRAENIVLLTVADTGIGIPENVKSKIFSPMMTTKSKGQGLGLAVAKRLVEAMNGKISFESHVGKGTKFIIELPTS